MSQLARILFCQCANAEIIPAPVRLTVLARIQAAGQPVEAVSDLCGLAAGGDSRLKALAQSSGPIRIIACFPRAVRWLFAAADAPLPEAAIIANMRTQTAEEILRVILGGHASGSQFRISDFGLPSFRNEENQATQSDLQDPQSEIRNEGSPKSEIPWISWFPVIDYSRCRHCRQCANFCLFGVYAIEDGGKVRVRNPANCKTNCPACARLCPQAAIIFPKYPADPINGAEVTPENLAREHVGETAEFGSAVGGNLLETLRKRAREAAAKSAAQVQAARVPLAACPPMSALAGKPPVAHNPEPPLSPSPTPPPACGFACPQCPTQVPKSDIEDLPANVQRILAAARQRAESTPNANPDPSKTDENDQ